MSKGSHRKLARKFRKQNRKGREAKQARDLWQRSVGPQHCPDQQQRGWAFGLSIVVGSGHLSFLCLQAKGAPEADRASVKVVQVLAVAWNGIEMGASEAASKRKLRGSLWRAGIIH